MNEHEAFEAWVKLEHPRAWPNVGVDGTYQVNDAYHNNKLNMMWCAWQARANHEPETGHWYSGEDIDALARELDVWLNGKEGAARQAKLCDIVAQIKCFILPQPLARKFAVFKLDGYPITTGIHLSPDFDSRDGANLFAAIQQSHFGGRYEVRPVK